MYIQFIKICRNQINGLVKIKFIESKLREVDFHMNTPAKNDYRKSKNLDEHEEVTPRD